LRNLLLATILASTMTAPIALAEPPAATAPFSLTAKWTGPYGGVPPWDKLTPALFPAALADGIAEQQREIDAITANSAPPTFDNTIGPYQLAGQTLDRVTTLFDVMTSNMSTPAYQALEHEWSPKLTAADDAILLDAKLFQRVKAVYDAREKAGLTPVQQRLVTRIYDRFVRQGANLDPAQKAKLSALNQELSGLFTTFSAKLLADEGTFITVTNAADLNGVPASLQASYAAAADEHKLPAGSFAIMNTRSAVDPLLTFCTNRALREKVWRAFVNRGDNGDANDTNATIERIVKLRAERAALLGFATHADWRMQDTMAKTPAAAEELMNRVWPAAVARVRQEVADQQAIAKAEGTSIIIEPWDYRFYQEKVRKARYDLDQAELKPYFELGHMIDASMYAAGRLYGLKFREITGQVPVFEPSVRVWEVSAADGTPRGLFYGDYFARTGKRSGAWMNTYRLQRRFGGAQTTFASNNNNFTRAAPGEPVLISLDDARTLFHEFGHAIHYLLQDVDYAGLAGTPRDFVEFPSQVNEHWVLTRDVLDRYARHYQTGAAMPQALVDKIEKTMTFNQGFATVEYLSAAIVDMKLHTLPGGVVDIDKFERETLAEIGMPKEIVMRHRLPQFGHLFSSDSYSAGYYSYLWSETMDADTWAAFKEAGSPWDQATADRLKKTLLSTGNETDRAEAYRAFRGRDPDVKALLRQRGFPVE